ncbi:MCE family protein [Alginatibacterium sediminis]|uniref:MCE family protein n=1 Tax=Alginatibacterium sediminis TaxID=2164068 RepID=A0A420EHH9_9ALTE|nr:MlaD family protein [Alginatibacterium sediminis]RKF20120.1 MCE family protein [Alginatibacterium sediminis]
MTELAQAQTKKPPVVSPIWLLPIIALGIGIWLVYRSWASAGVLIEIQFENANGIKAGQTLIYYQGLDVGTVRKISLNQVSNGVIVEAEIKRSAEKLLRSDSQFWLVAPKASITEISGLDALVGGNYIALAAGEGEAQYEFIGSLTPPALLNGSGLNIELSADNLGSLNVGSAIYYKQIQVGEIQRFELSQDDQSVKFSASIDAEYQNLVRMDSRFWNVSGIDIDISTSGIKVETGSLASIIAGGVSFDSPSYSEPADNKHLFKLYDNYQLANRGNTIRVYVDEVKGFKENSSQISFQGLPIAYLEAVVLLEDQSFEAIFKIIEGYQQLFTTNSQLLSIDPKLSLDGIENPQAFIGSRNFELIYAQGENNGLFDLRQSAKPSETSFTIELNAEEARGLAIGSAIDYRGVKIGHLSSIDLNNGELFISADILDSYRPLINQHSRFYKHSLLHINAGLEGITVQTGEIKSALSGGLGLITRADAKPIVGFEDKFPIFVNEEAARLAQHSEGAKSIRLKAKHLGSVAKGSPLLFQELQVGQIVDFSMLSKGEFLVELEIWGPFSHLLDSHTRFWESSGFQVEASLAGVNIDAASIESLLRGGISFDHFNQLDQSYNRVLYPDRESAISRVTKINIDAKKGYGLRAGMDIRHNDQTIGEVESVNFSDDLKLLNLEAKINHPFEKHFAKAGAKFWLSTSEISLSGSKNIGNLITGDYISASPGKGKLQKQFSLHEDQPLYAGKTLPLRLKSQSMGSLSKGNPVYYRQLQVGTIVATGLANTGESVYIDIEIEKRYAHLVQRNSKFWHASGFEFNLGFGGARLKMESIESLVSGGIVFATPPASTTPARRYQVFDLHAKANDEWLQWYGDAN